MLRNTYPSFREVLATLNVVRVAGAHNALGAVLAQQAGFEAVWSSSFEISAARCLPDASLLGMAEYLQAANHMQRALRVPVVADCDTGYGNALNVAHLVHEYEASGITAICLEDKLFPKMNSFVEGADHELMPLDTFVHNIRTAKRAQIDPDFFVIARTEALIHGLGVREAIHRCEVYAAAGADAVLVHSKFPTNEQILDFLAHWNGTVPVVVVPTTYPSWHLDEAAAAGVSVVIYANQGLRATVAALRGTFRSIITEGSSAPSEGSLASVADVFALQRLEAWQDIAG